jgi:hypothetical protein
MNEFRISVSMEIGVMFWLVESDICAGTSIARKACVNPHWQSVIWSVPIGGMV